MYKYLFVMSMFSYSLLGMEGREPALSAQEEKSFLSILPAELRQELSEFKKETIAQEFREKFAQKAIPQTEQIDFVVKRLKDLKINLDVPMLNAFLELLQARYGWYGEGGSEYLGPRRLRIAARLATPAAIQWLQEQIKNPQTRKEFMELVKKVIQLGKHDEATLNEVKSYLAALGDVNATDQYGWTALMFAASGNLPVVQFLLDNKANVNLRHRTQDEAKTALQIAQEWRERLQRWKNLDDVARLDQIIKLLKDHGAQE